MKYDKMIVGEKCEFTTNSVETQLNNNVVVIGGSGSGKSMSYSEPKLLELKNSNMIMKISKRKLIDKYTPLLKSRDYKVEVLDLVNPKKSTVAFDPLYYFKSDADVTHLAEAIVNLDPKKAFQTKADPYWDEAAVNLISAFIYLTLAIDDDATLSKVITYIKDLKISDIGNTVSTNLDYLFNSIEKQKNDHPALPYWNSFIQLPPKTARCVYSSLIVSFNSVFSTELLDMMNCENKFSFEKISKEKTVLFVLTSAVSPALHSFANLFFAYAIKELFEIAEEQQEGKLPISVHMLCDDFAVGGKILNFEEYISIFREKDISVSILLQSETQLASMYGDINAATIINNCDTYIYMGGMDLQTCEHISKRLNLPLEDVLYMPIGQEFVFRRGQKPIVTKRYDILNNELYEQITDKFGNKNSKKEFLKNTAANTQVNKFEKIDLAQKKKDENEEDEEDLQMLLEAKFDELFGPMESS